MPRALFVLIFAGACGFELPVPGGSIGIDAPGDGPTRIDDGPTDAPPDVAVDAMIDAPPDAPPVWTDVETQTIACSGASITSTTVLAAGVTYRLRASGVCTVNDGTGSLGDPEWHYFNIGTPRDTEASVDNGIAINDASPGASKLPDWGAYSAGHSYTVDWVGAGAAITARDHDSNYTNNDGSLSLVIQAFQ